MNVYFMRHGETDWNTIKRLQGTTDIPLNKNGEELAKVTAANMKKDGIKFDVIYSSPLVRALKTAEYMNEYSKAPVIVDKRIREYCFGQAEGVTFDELKVNPKFVNLRNWFLDPENFVAELGAESYDEFFGRLSSFLNEVLIPLEKENSNQNVLIVCHGGVVRGLLKVMLDWDISRFAETKIPNCGINLCTLHDGRFELEFTAKKYY